jgi:Ferritin-like
MLSQPMCLKVYLLVNLFLEVKRSTILLIDTREEMIYALNEAAEIEHGLMIQYLFAALTMKKDLRENATGTQQELIRKWEAQILGVSREEMAHLGTVCNLLSSVMVLPTLSALTFLKKQIAITHLASL